jgi:hypothetical protein
MGNRTISVDSEALKELIGAARLGLSYIEDQLHRKVFPGRSETETEISRETIQEALRNIGCEDDVDRARDLLARLLDDGNYHERDCAALERVLALAELAS